MSSDSSRENSKLSFFAADRWTIADHHKITCTMFHMPVKKSEEQVKHSPLTGWQILDSNRCKSGASERGGMPLGATVESAAWWKLLPEQDWNTAQQHEHVDYNRNSAMMAVTSTEQKHSTATRSVDYNRNSAMIAITSTGLKHSTATQSCWLQQKQCNDGSNRYWAETAQHHNHVNYNSKSTLEDWFPPLPNFMP